MHINFNQYSKQKGISLIELVIFIVILAVALTGITVIYLNATRYSADPMVRIRSTELAQSTLEEILLKAYDNNTKVGGGCVKFAVNSRCPASNPNASATLGTDGEASRADYNDVDDYTNKLYCGQNVVAANTACPSLTCENLQNESGINISAEYTGFSVCVRVNYAGNELNAVSPGTGTSVLANDAKRIDVIVTDPLNSRINLSAYRLNY